MKVRWPTTSSLLTVPERLKQRGPRKGKEERSNEGAMERKEGRRELSLELEYHNI